MSPATEWRRTAPAAVALAREIGPGLTNPELAAALNNAGHTTGTGKPFDTTAACNLRYAYRIGSPDLLAVGELTPRAVAQRLGVATGVVHAWLSAGTCPPGAARPGAGASPSHPRSRPPAGPGSSTARTSTATPTTTTARAANSPSPR
jgi:hypothetical protein